MNGKRIIAWCSPEQAVLVRDSIAAAGLTLAAVGSPDRSDATALAAQFSVSRLDDLRKAASFEGVDALWLASPEPIDPEVRGLLLADEYRVFSTEPPYGSLPDAASNDELRTPPVFVPFMRQSPGFRAASEVMAHFGPVSCLNVFLRSGVGQGTLSARLFDAMDMVNTLCGSAESINAALAGPLADVPEQLSLLRGHMTANLRFKANRCACIALSDQAGSWFRGVTVLGEHGHLRISDTGFEWIGVDGSVIDRHAEPAASSLPNLLGAQFRRLLDTSLPSDPPLDHVTLLSLCEAARLSCMTGEDEGPLKLIEVMTKP